MQSETQVSALILFAAFTVLSVVLIFPATFGLSSIMSGGTASLRAAVAEELDYCQENTSGVDCGCFSQKSGQIMSFSNPKVEGYDYAYKQDLARGQAKQTCS